jgi:uncharacterized SAM-binding protein YcdF (DUF218 family)
MSGHMRAMVSTIALPPASLVILAMLGLAFTVLGSSPATGLLLAAIALVMLWLTSCNAIAVWLSRVLLPQFEALQPAVIEAQIRAKDVEAIVVLGAGIDVHCPEYGSVQLSYQSAARLRYGAMLSRFTALPLGFAGGLGWASVYAQGSSEAAVARLVAQADYGITLRWADEASRDTRGNAQEMASLLQRDSVRVIALVTHAWHMPRAKLAFEDVGLRVLPAPMGFIASQERRILEWFPSTHGLMASRQVLREWLALQVYLARRFS